MSVKIRVCGREFTLSWEEFERMSAKRSHLAEPITILDIRNGGTYVCA